MTTRYIPYMTHVEIDSYLKSGKDRVIIGIGATENHGPHAPLGTDTIVTEEVAWRLAEKTDALCAPVLPVGFSPQHLDWPGSISVNITTIAALLLEMIDALHHAGFRKFVLFSGHGGNKPIIDLVARNAKLAHPDTEALTYNLLALQTGSEFQRRVENQLGTRFEGIWGAHGGEQESACAMLRREDLVHLELAPDEPPLINEYLKRTRDPYASSVSYDLKTYAPNGSWGNARGATREQGLCIVETMAAMMAEAVNERFA